MSDEPGSATVPGVVEPPRPRGLPLPSRTDVPVGLDDKLRLAEQLGMVTGDAMPEWLRGKPANILAVMFAAQALDIPLWTGVQGLYAEAGSVAVEATLSRALVQRAGHLILVAESSPFHAVVRLRRWDHPEVEHVGSFTIQEATVAGLAGLDWYRKYPERQMIARATGQAVQLGAADVVNGFVYSREELSGGGFRQDRPALTVAEAAPIDDDVLTELATGVAEAGDARALSVVWKRAAKLRALGCQVPGGSTLIIALQERLAELSGGDVVTPALGQNTGAVVERIESPPATARMECGCPAAEFLQSGGHVTCGQAKKKPPAKRAAKKAPGTTVPRGARKAAGGA